jgi:alkanesulfonate monooxygenase SsuD/methylene tetrahydromethanopterin reductase-like flavin-dependent oxidoreductase (luciferase family)
VNIVVGWNEGEFDMFGVQQREHDARDISFSTRRCGEPCPRYM